MGRPETSQNKRKRAAALDRIQMAMEAVPMNNAELAEALGLSRASVTGWFRKGSGAMPGGEILLDLPRVLNVSGHWLLTGEGPRSLDRTQPQGIESAIVHEVLLELAAVEDFLARRRAEWLQPTHRRAGATAPGPVTPDAALEADALRRRHPPPGAAAPRKASRRRG